jgi:hypothetical protein
MAERYRSLVGPLHPATEQGPEFNTKVAKTQRQQKRGDMEIPNFLEWFSFATFAYFALCSFI